MFKKLKKRLEVEEGQPVLLGKPGTAVRSSINDSSSSVLVESVYHAQQQVKANDSELHTSTHDGGTSAAHELKEVSQFETTSQKSGMFISLVHVHS